MAKIQIARIDFRLIHGQVATKWLKMYPAKKVVIVDDALSQDDFMADIYSMAAPSGVKVEITDVASVKKRLEEISSTVFLLFKDVETCCRTMKEGVTYGNLVVGGVPSEAGKSLVFSGVYLNQEEYKKLQELQESGITVTAQSTPDDTKMSLEQIGKKI